MKQNRLNEMLILISAIRKMVWEQQEGFKNMDIFSALRFMTLQYIADEKNPTMKNISEFLKIKPSSATSLIGGLEKTGYIIRVEDKDDRRIVRLSITFKGKRELAKAFKIIKVNTENFYSRLSPEEQKQLINILKKITNNN
ncbi:MAG: MarR family transcriptional regulator [Patescibacteria group bacterium]